MSGVTESFLQGISEIASLKKRQFRALTNQNLPHETAFSEISKRLLKEKKSNEKLNAKAFILALVLMVISSDVLAQTRIRFARGRTSVTVSGKMVYGERSYVLGARRGQYLSANVSSRNGCTRFYFDRFDKLGSD